MVASSRRSPGARRGFSLVEMMVATAVLGIGTAGLVRLYTSSVRGVRDGEARAAAIRAASQRAEELATMQPEALPACNGAPTCRGDDFRSFAAELAPQADFDCTRWVDNALAAESAAPEEAAFRVDSVVAPHPDSGRHEGRVVTVSVCWRDGGGLIHEVQTRRFVVPGA